MAYLINDRWTRIDEEAIFQQLLFLPVLWYVKRIDTPAPRYYLFGGGYAYPYSLPIEVVQRLATRLNNEAYMFDWQHWRDLFIRQPGYNDAKSYSVVVSNTDGAQYDVIGVHHLTPDENRGNHHIFIDVLDENNNRISGAMINWTWQGRTEPGLPNPVIIDKPADQIADLAFFSGVTVNIWHPSGNGVTGLSANHPDELGPNGEKWNTIGHHSFIVVFRKIGDTSPPPDPEPPDPGPDPEPPLEDVVMLIKKDWIEKQPTEGAFYVIRGDK